MTPFRRDWVTLGFVIALVVMALIAAISFRSISGFMTRAESVEHTYQVLLDLQDLLSHLRDAESGQRGFLLAGDAAQLSHFASALETVGERQRSVRELTGDNPEQQRRLDALDSLLGEKTRSLEFGIRLARDATDRQSVLEWVRAGEGTRQMDRIRSLIAEMTVHEEALLARRAAESSSSARMAVGTVIVGNAVSLALLLIIFAYLRTEIRRRAEVEAALRRNHDQIEDLYNHAPCGYHSLNADGVFVRINDTELDWLGYSRDEIVGRKRFVDLLTPESVGTFRSSFPRFKETGAISDLEFAVRRKDGSVLDVSLSATAIRDAAGAYLMSRSTMFDISARKDAERRIAGLNRDLERHARELEHTNRELESFSYSVSHDLRSPLRAIDGFSRILEEDHVARLDAEGLRLLSVIRECSQAMGRLIDDLLAFSRLGRKPLSATTVDMEALVAEVLGEVLPSGAPRPEITTHPLPAAWGDAALLRQVWLNLLANAIKFSSKRELPELEVGGHSQGGENIYHVRDNGVGFDMRYYEKLFGVFQRLHREAEFPGTGVGLAIVQRVVARHGGRAWAEGVPEQGATFYFSLPATQGAT